MESFIANVVVQGSALPQDTWSCISRYWNWFFWIGFIVGLLGGAVQFFLKRPEAL